MGTFYKKISPNKKNIFKKTLNTYPEIGAKVYLVNENVFHVIVNSFYEKPETELTIGKYANSKNVNAILSGNKFFGKPSIITGDPGSGKSFTIGNILEKTIKLENSNLIVFDLYNEYEYLENAKKIEIGNCDYEFGIVPLWFFNYEEMNSLFIELFETESINERATILEHILTQKKKANPETITMDDIAYFSTEKLKEHLFSRTFHKGEQNKQKQYNRLLTKMNDKKYNFIFSEKKDIEEKDIEEKNAEEIEYLKKFIYKIISNKKEKIKIINLSKVPSNILPIIISLITRLIYYVQSIKFNREGEVKNPILLVYDEADLYMFKENLDLKTFEMVSKEGKMYEISMLIISRNLSTLNSTIISQCNNIISLKITNDKDIKTISTILKNSFEELTEILPTLAIGECIIIGDSIAFPIKIILDEPTKKPKVITNNFWDKWNHKKF